MLEKRYGSLQNVPPEAKRKVQQLVETFAIQNSLHGVNNTNSAYQNSSVGSVLNDPVVYKGFKYGKYLLLLFGPIGWILFFIFSRFSPEKISARLHDSSSVYQPPSPASGQMIAPSSQSSTSIQKSPTSFSWSAQKTLSTPLSKTPSYSSSGLAGISPSSSPLKTDNGVARAIFIVGVLAVCLFLYFICSQLQ